MKLRNRRIARTLGFGLSAAAIGLVAVIAMSAGTLFAAKPGAGGGAPAKCTDVPIALTVKFFAGTAVEDDGKGFYKGGADGVYNAVVHVCDYGNGASYDATVGLINSTRSMMFAFTPLTAGSPEWASLQVKPFINVNNILWGLQNTTPDFTTQMFFSYIRLPNDRKDYRLHFQPGLYPNIDARGPWMPAPESYVNSPSVSSSVLVESTPNPAGCTTLGANKVSWTITPVQSESFPMVPTFVGTLTRIASGKLPGAQIGQYSMPFQLQIDTLGCLDSTFKKLVN